MFAWVYNKTLDDGNDYWVVGTGYDKNIQIVKKEGYSSTMSLANDERIRLGKRNFLMVGDAAGLIDPTGGGGHGCGCAKWKTGCQGNRAFPIKRRAGQLGLCKIDEKARQSDPQEPAEQHYFTQNKR